MNMHVHTYKCASLSTLYCASILQILGDKHGNVVSIHIHVRVHVVVTQVLHSPLPQEDNSRHVHVHLPCNILCVYSGVSK